MWIEFQKAVAVQVSIESSGFLAFIVFGKFRTQERPPR
jgi:hypothetical protein